MLSLRNGQDSRQQRAVARLKGLLSCHPGLEAHGEAVGRLAAATARRLGFGEPEVSDLLLAGRLHDVGKLALDERILYKPGPLDDDELAAIRRHPLIGARLLREAGLRRIATWVLCHHERPDGRGYPIGLELAEIPAPARILAAADACDAMLTDRVYRPALRPHAAVLELRRGSGRQFEPPVVEALLAELFSGAGRAAAAR